MNNLIHVIVEYYLILFIAVYQIYALIIIQQTVIVNVNEYSTLVVPILTKMIFYIAAKQSKQHVLKYIHLLIK